MNLFFDDEHPFEWIGKLDPRLARLIAVDLLGKRCRKCGATRKLIVHHADFDGNEHREFIEWRNAFDLLDEEEQRALYYASIVEAIVKSEPPRFELLCRKCHREAHVENKQSTL